MDPENFHHIPLPPPGLQLRMEARPPIRKSRARDYIKSDKPFLIELLFRRDIDLALFEKFVSNSPIRIAEYKGLQQGPSRIFITDSRISDNATEDHLWKWAEEELPKVQAAIAVECPFYAPAIVQGLILLFPGGEARSTRLPVLVRNPSISDVPLTKRILESPNDPLCPYLLKWEHDKDFSEAMMYCGQALGFPGANQWANLYRAYEVIADRFGGDDGIVNCVRACSRNELERFKRTINHQEAIGAFSRHARLNCQPPPNPMRFETALEFVLGLIAFWLKSGQ